MPEPVVSIVVRTYNRPERLAVCLDSLAQQTYRDLEAVVSTMRAVMCRV